MKKTQVASPRKTCLSLNRETIQILSDPVLLELAGGVSALCTGFSEGGLGCHTITGSGGTC